MNPYQGWQPPQQMGWQPPYPVFVPMPDSKGQLPRGKSLKKQFKEWTEMVDLMKGNKPGEKKDDPKKPEIKMSPITFFMWIWALSVPIAALNVGLVMIVGKYIMSMFK